MSRPLRREGGQEGAEVRRGPTLHYNPIGIVYIDQTRIIRCCPEDVPTDRSASLLEYHMGHQEGRAHLVVLSYVS
jgi:hypothetical protein